MMADYPPPTDRLGVFKRLAEVPEARRFRRYQSVYDGEDTWAVYRGTVELSERMSDDWALFAERWKDHMAERGRHHALARPSDVESWSAWLLEQFRVDRSYQHWNVIEGFYEWLKWRTDHPHAYNPFHMAADVSDSSARTIWQRKMEKREA